LARRESEGEKPVYKGRMKNRYSSGKEGEVLWSNKDLSPFEPSEKKMSCAGVCETPQKKKVERGGGKVERSVKGGLSARSKSETRDKVCDGGF